MQSFAYSFSLQLIFFSEQAFYGNYSKLLETILDSSKESYTTLKSVISSFKICFQNYGRLKRKFLRSGNTSSTFLKFEPSRLCGPMLKTRKNTIRNQFEQQWFNVIGFQKPRRVYTAIWYQFKNPCAIKKGRFKLSVSIPAKCTSRAGLSKGGQSTNIKKSPKIQNVLRPWNQILAYKTMLWMSVLRTFAWCFHIMEMSSTHRTTAYHCRHSFFDGSYERFSFRHEWFFISASLKVRPRTDDKDVSQDPCCFFGL